MTEPNDRELLIRIDERQAKLLSGQGAIEGEVKEIKEAQTNANLAQAKCATLQSARWEGHEKEHTSMEQNIRRKSNIGDALALGVATVAAALNINWKQ